MQTEVALEQRSGERVCVAVDELDYMRCECKSGGTYMPNMCKKRNRFVDSGLEVCVRCGKKKRQYMCYKYKIKDKITFLNGRPAEDTSMSNTWKKNKGFHGRWSRCLRKVR